MEQLGAAIAQLASGQGLGWNNLLDIALVAIFVYYLLVLIRGTRAVQLLLGVVVIVAIYGIAVLLKLTLTALVLQGLSVVALFGVVVVFQPELRRALGQLGRLGPLNMLLQPTTVESVD